MAENDDVKLASDDIMPVEEEVKAELPPTPAPEKKPLSGGGGWGGWGFSPLSYLTDLQKAATVAAEEISRNAVEVAKTAAKSLSDMQNAEEEDSESSNENDKKVLLVEEESDDDEDHKKRKAALDKLENASEDSFLGQGIKALDDTVENLASGAWEALGNAWRGGSNLVHKIENSAVNIAESIQSGGLPAAPPSLIETGKAFTAKGMEVLELMGKETMDLLSIEVDKDIKETEGKINEDQLLEEVTFDRYFYIYGGSEQLEELESLSNHHTLLYNRKKAKLSSEEKSLFDAKLKEVQQIFDLSFEVDESVKGKKLENASGTSMDELKKLYDSSLSKVAELAAGFEKSLSGLGPNDIIQRTPGRLNSLHSEGVHRLSEMCCFAITHLLMLGNSIISDANKAQDHEDSVQRAMMIRINAQSMNGNLEAVSNCFITGISDVAEACIAAIKGAAAESHNSSQTLIQEKASLFCENLRADYKTAVSKIQDGLQFLSYVVLSTSMPVA